MTVQSLVAILYRVLRSLITLLLCVTVVFVVLRTAGDPVDQLLPQETRPPSWRSTASPGASTGRSMCNT